MVTMTSGIYGAVPDWRYAGGVPAGAVAELFGLGTHGLRWRQLLVVMIGSWLSGNASLLMTFTMTVPSGPLQLALIALWPAFFLFSAITAIRSFQSGVMVALFTGALYTVLLTAARFFTSEADLFHLLDGAYWMRLAAASFVWPALTMFALQFAVAGRRRWRRMIYALVVVSVIEAWLGTALYLGQWDPESVVQSVAPRMPSMIVSALIWTAAFRVGLSRFGRRDD